MLVGKACAVWKKGKGIIDICLMIVADSLGNSVSYLSKIGSLTDWDEQQIQCEIDKVLHSRCKPWGEVATNIEKGSQ
jgi:hypothetical protein